VSSGCSRPAAERAEAEWRAGARQLGVERSGRVGAWWARGGGGGKGQGSRRRASAASSPAEVDDRRWWRAGQRASAVEALASWAEGRAAAPTPRSVLGFIRHRWRFTVANASFRIGFQYRAATIFFTVYSIPGVAFCFPYSIADSLIAGYVKGGIVYDGAAFCNLVTSFAVK
jgi:hypothetical protein